MEAVEIREQGSASMVSNNRKLTIEDYLDFMKNRHRQLNFFQLRKIISMHGFRAIEGQKSILLDAVKTINLMDLRRSTLKDGSVSGDACLTLTSVINDLNDLQWQECHPTSLITQGPAAKATKDLAVPVNRKKPKELGKKPVKIEADDSIISNTGTIVVDSSTTVVKLKRSKNLGKLPVEVEADGSIISPKNTIDADSSETVVKFKRLEDLGKKPVEVAADDTIIHSTGTNVAAGSTSVPEKGGKSKGLGKASVEIAADDSIISTSSATVAVKRRKSKGLEKKPVEDSADDSTKSTTVSGKRKRLKGLGMKPVVGALAADRSVSTLGTTLAAVSTT